VNKLKWSMVFVSFGLAAAVASADVYVGRAVWSRVSGKYIGNGGEFTISKASLAPGLSLDTSAYASTVKDQAGSAPSFQSFCLEAGETIKSPMDIVMSTTSIDELTGVVGAEGSGSHAINGGKPYGDNLDTRTAYLYTQFAKGVLSGYAYTNTLVNGLNRAQTAGTLQRVIWALEQEGGADFTQSFQNVTLNATQQALAQAWVNEAVTANWTTIGNVRVLNTWRMTQDSQGNWVSHVGDLAYKAQDQIYLTPVPAPAALGLGMLGLGLVGWVKRRMA